jgi:hypothetical protein
MMTFFATINKVFYRVINLTRNGSKVVIKAQSGNLSIFSWGDWEDSSDCFPGHPMSVSMFSAKRYLYTGSSDVRSAVVQPNFVGNCWRLNKI